MMKRTAIVFLAFISVAPLSGQQRGASQNAGGGLSSDTRQKLTASLDKATAFLAKKQRPDGLWENNPGINAMAATAILRQPGDRAKHLAAAGKTLDALAKLAKP